jgi:hypothetical protein
MLDARRQGATSEAYMQYAASLFESLQVEREERPRATQPFDFAQGHEPVEWQMTSRWWIREL